MSPAPGGRSLAERPHARPSRPSPLAPALSPAGRRVVGGPIGGLVGGLVAVASVALGVSAVSAPAGASGLASSGHVRPQTISPGVTVTHRSIRLKGHPEKVALMRVDLSSRHVRIAPVLPRDAIGAPRQTVESIARRTHAVGGVNADWFDLSSSAAVPRGALITGGDVAKTPRPDWQANLYVRKNGRAAIGPIPFEGTVSRPARPDSTGHGDRARSHSIFSVNTPVDAAHGRMTFVTHDLMSLGIVRPCTVATGVTNRKGARVVTGVRTDVVGVPRVADGGWALVACGNSTDAQWLRSDLRRGDHVTVALRFPQGRPQLAVSGGSVLVQNGRAYKDRTDVHLQGANPETFACVNRSGTSLLLGVIDGRSRTSWGVDMPTLTGYLRSLDCWSGMIFDGGGSTTMVARMPGQPLAILNHPSDGWPRPVADGLYVYRRK